MNLDQLEKINALRDKLISINYEIKSLKASTDRVTFVLTIRALNERYDLGLGDYIQRVKEEALTKLEQLKTSIEQELKMEGIILDEKPLKWWQKL